MEQAVQAGMAEQAALVELVVPAVQEELAAEAAAAEAVTSLLVRV